MEELGVEYADHAGAGAGGHHDVPVTLQDVYGAASQWHCIAPEAGVEGRLTAAGLARREVDLDAEALQDVHSA